MYPQLSSTRGKVRVRVGADTEKVCFTSEEMDQTAAQMTLYGIGACVAGVFAGYWFHKLYGSSKRTR